MTVQRPTASPRRQRLPAPEIIAGALTVAVVAIVVGTNMAGGSSPAPIGSTPRPSSSATPEAPTPTPPVRPEVVALLGELNDQLIANGAVLRDEIERTTLQTEDVQGVVRQVNGDAGIGADAVQGLGGALGEGEVGARMLATYRTIGVEATRTLTASVNNDVAYRRGATKLVALIRQLPLLQDELEALLVPPSPSPSASASPSASPSPPPSSAPPPSPSAASSSAAPSGEPASGSPPPFIPGGPEPSRAPDEQIDNPGFEEPVGVEWVLETALGSRATNTIDTTDPATGTRSARIDIATGSLAYGGIVLRQPGLQIEAGRNYTFMLNVRAASVRDIRIRIVSVAGTTYAIKVVPVTAAWSQQVFPITTVGTDLNAVLEIQFGRSNETTWIDTVSFRPAPTF